MIYRIIFNVKRAALRLKCKIPDYKLIEVLGILLDNAIEAVQDYDLKNIWVEMYNGSVVKTKI